MALRIKFVDVTSAKVRLHLTSQPVRCVVVEGSSVLSLGDSMTKYPGGSRGLAYYAHCQWTYGSEVEQKDIRLIESLGYRVYNPNNTGDEQPFKDKGMDYFDELMEEHDFDICFIRPESNGMVTAGVGYEAMKFFEAGKPVLEIPCPVLPRLLTPEATRELYRWYGYRKLSEEDKR